MCEACESYDPDAFYVGWKNEGSSDMFVDPQPFIDEAMAASEARMLMLAESVSNRVYYVLTENDEGQTVSKKVLP